jgi:hypothetical protein
VFLDAEIVEGDARTHFPASLEAKSTHLRVVIPPLCWIRMSTQAKHTSTDVDAEKSSLLNPIRPKTFLYTINDSKRNIFSILSRPKHNDALMMCSIKQANNALRRWPLDVSE